MRSRTRRALPAATRTAAAVAATALVAAMATTAHATPGSNPAPDGAGADSGGTTAGAAPHTPALADGRTTVTLVTGDVVDVGTTDGGALTIGVEPADGGAVRTQQVGDHYYVLPDAALPYLAAGTLDRRLFDVTALLEMQYDDETTDATPLILERASTRARAAELPGTERTLDLPSIDADAVAASKTKATAFWSAVAAQGDRPSARSTAAAGTFGGGIEKIWLDGKAETTLDHSTAQIGAPEAWAAGFDGTGATVAVLDTGIDATHPDVADAITETQSFVPGEEATTDVQGHGTHVASTVLGSGAASDGLYKGVAPGADLLVGKVLDNSGYGQDSWIIAGMEWGAANADVVSMSLGDSSLNDGTDPMAQALNALSEETGALFVVAAGNSYAEGSLGSPGTADAALTVGAVDDGDVRADFSSYGPRVGDHAIKPDLTAPGVDIAAARSQQSGGTGSYVSMSGTSMATPHVAGAAAILKGAHPELTGEQLKAALVSSAADIDAPAYEVGTGRLDVPAALDGVDGSGGGFLGFYDWPHDGDEPATGTVTYTNTTDADVTLDLSTDLAGPDGAASDLVTLSADQVVVPANGTADVTFAADADDAALPGKYSGAVVATDASGEVTVRTATALIKEEERYGLDITALDRSGEPATGYVDFYRYGDQFVSSLPIDPATGEVRTQRLLPGVYSATAFLDVAGSKGAGSTGVALVGDPQVVVDGADQALVFDASEAVELTLDTPKESDVAHRRFQFFNDSGIGGQYATFGATYGVPADVDSFYAAPTGAVDSTRFDFGVRWRAIEPALDLVARNPWRVAIDPVYQTGSARLDGRVSLRAVAAGTGTAAEYDGVDAAGKAVLVTRADAVTAEEREAAAQAAGAALLVVVNNRPGPLVEYVTQGDLPVVSVTAAEGAKLLPAAAKGWLTLSGTAQEFPSYLYDVARNWSGEIPAKPALAPTKKQLATVVSRYNDTEDRLAVDNRADCRDYQWPPCISFRALQPTATERTDYVSTYDDVTWYEGVEHESTWEQRGVRQAYEPRSTTVRNWFAPVTAPRTGDGYWGPWHDSTWFAVNVAPAGGQDGITGSFPWGETPVTSRLYQNDTLVRQTIGQAVQTTVPVADGPQKYRFEIDTDSAGDTHRYSTRTRTSWTFVADQADAGVPGQTGTPLPLVQLDYDVDTALDGTVRAGAVVPLAVAPYAQPDAPRAGAVVVGATLDVSYDGGDTWSKAKLRKDGDRWVTALRIPSRGAELVSLRATARDDAGNAVTQEVISAFGISGKR
ncbi:subtilisin family serine protease [Promicromonospora sp. AC04]|uniref:S8 family serine peptidase n=1 Tax=Promicromonospora sp. AC04 TaxID=2135723 RepID=UPI000D355C60|nr:S8 family serine peptidase [Promicromonospora sp. AC04]PUB32070.1 subtilisin family serine protease [Promicromonospora sp. AC04]